LPSEILEPLNPAQREAVTHTDGPLLVLAGAGSGKTRVITHRVAYLVRAHDVPPWEITAVTFTNKAAAEMRERVAALMGVEESGAHVSTFHSFCLRVLRQDADRVGYRSGFLVYDTSEQLAVVKNAMEELEIPRENHPPRQVLSRISGAKNRLQRPDQFRDTHRDYVAGIIGKIYERYQERLQAANAMDFDDLIMQTIRLFTEHPDVLTRVQRGSRYLMVDEYQDTNHSQYRLIRFLSKATGNVCVVGDEDQSIYAFRGSDYRNILRFEKDFPGARVIKLEQNYRSTRVILDAAGSLVSCNRERIGKILFTDNPRGDKVRVSRLYTDRDEAGWVGTELRQVRRERDLGDAAVLYRTNAQSRLVEEALLQAGIPYRIYGAVRFYDRKEVKDVLAYLKLLANPDDDVSLQRIINTPPRRIGKTTLQTLREVASQRHESLLRAIPVAVELGVAGRAASALTRFTDLVESLRGEVLALPPDALVREVVKQTGYVDYARSEGPEIGRARLENLEQLVTAAAEHDEAGGEGLAAFLDRVSLVSDADVVDGESGVALMTLHCAKGLEFPVVFIVGLEEGLLPHSRAAESPSDLEEERRLLYVGMTRARERLTLSSCCVRRIFGRETPVQPSPFLDEIPPELIDSAQPDSRQVSDPQAALDGDYTYEPLEEAPRPRRKSGLDFDAIMRKGLARREKELTYEYDQEAAPRFRPGSRVYHPRYGEGKVLSSEGEGDRLKLTVSFAGYRPKKFLAKFAGLQPLR
jgi:DNA helicase-2/ATP-dependent DNA helicase PcrA